MGMDQQQTGSIGQGMNIIQELANLSGSRADGSNSTAGEAEHRAAMAEIEARDKALDIEKNSSRADQLRAERENRRASQNVGWGEANLAMSGSKKLIRDANRTRDLQDEEDVLFETEMAAKEALSQGHHQANLLRINSDSSPSRSTLSLGSSIYTRR